MNWRGTTTPQERIFASLPYLLPLIEGLVFSAPFFSQFPGLAVVLIPLMPLIKIYTGFPFAGLIIFFVLLLLVVRNPNVSHFIRFNTMQAILLDIILIVCNLVLSLLGPALGSGLIMQTLMNVVFLGVLAAVAYSVVQSIMGRYAEIPTISEAVHMQVR